MLVMKKFMKIIVYIIIVIGDDMINKKEVLTKIEKSLRRMENKNLNNNIYYDNLKEKYDLILNGYNFEVKDKTKELKTAIAFIGGQIPRCNFKNNGNLININNGISIEKAKEIAKEF